jgi:autotransporter-associated beta strand protein
LALGSSFATATNVPAGFMLQYTSNQLDLVASAATFSGSATWASLAPGTTGTWNNSANWLDNNHQPGVPGASLLPTRTADTATFSGSGSITQITLDTNPTLAALSFSNSNYTLTGGSLTFLSSASTATLTVSNGSQQINSGVAIAGGSLAISISNSGSLGIAGIVSDDGSQRSLILGGDGSGTLTLSNSLNTYMGGTYVNSGTLIATADGAIPSGTSLYVGAGASTLFASTVEPEYSPVAAATHDVVAVPEPGTIVLLAMGLVVGLGVWRRRKRIGMDLA